MLRPLARPVPRLVAVLLVGSALAAGCGGDDDTPAAPAGSVTPATTSGTVHVSADAPSTLSKMVCEEDEVHAGVEYYTKQELTAPPVPTWVDRLYTCPYLLGDGTLTLSVKELDDVPQTDAYYDGLKAELGDVGRIYLGQEGFQTTGGSVVVRKDNLVLLVDTSGIVDGPPPLTRSDIAVNMATIIMACWTGES